MDAARCVALAFLVLSLTLAGCNTATDPHSDTNTPDVTVTPLPVHTPTPSPTPTPHDSSLNLSMGNSNLDGNEKPHHLRLSNSRDKAAVAATLYITRDDGETLFKETYYLAPGAEYDGVIEYKANYTVTVSVGNRNATEHLSKSVFDCNDSVTAFTVTSHNLTTRTRSTTLGCPTPSPE